MQQLSNNGSCLLDNFEFFHKSTLTSLDLSVVFGKDRKSRSRSSSKKKYPPSKMFATNGTEVEWIKPSIRKALINRNGISI